MLAFVQQVKPVEFCVSLLRDGFCKRTRGPVIVMIPRNAMVIPQNALIKFVRNAPSSLRWFRSDLSQENIAMLKKERLGIAFLNRVLYQISFTNLCVCRGPSFPTS